ncbi:MAG: hypothetical protein GY810_01580 [Aureispira sp.]|nr:hypothetical protein [Aureispira sp.]
MKNLTHSFILFLFTLSTQAQPDLLYAWADQIGDTGNDAGYSLETDDNGNVYITVFFAGTVDFDFSSNTANLTSEGGENTYLLKTSEKYKSSR